jgi:hypothetical protein
MDADEAAEMRGGREETKQVAGEPPIAVPDAAAVAAGERISDDALEVLVDGIAELSKHVRNILFALVTLAAFVLLSGTAGEEANADAEHARLRAERAASDLETAKVEELTRLAEQEKERAAMDPLDTAAVEANQVVDLARRRRRLQAWIPSVPLTQHRVTRR